MNGIKKCRQERGLTQMELAKILEVSQSAVAMWETGKARPRASLLVNISKTLNTTVDVLLDDEHESPEKSEIQ